VSTIDRVRFYDGEFLRAFDFSDEQTYHMEMRRRLNRYLHLYGIVQGLNLVGSTNAGVTQVSIMPGLAIDAFGREIYVFASYTLGDSDITANRISRARTYDVWLRYRKTPNTPPSSGYSVCNQTNQYTRWVELFNVVLLPSPSSPFTTPLFSDDDTDNPSLDQVGVLLGTVYIDPTSPTGTFSNPLFDPNFNRCVLLGVIAQRIRTPPGYDATHANPPFSFLNQSPAGVPNTPLSPPASLEIEPNIFADQNLIVGPDFPLKSAAGATTPISVNNTSPLATSGSVKIAGDLFVQGNIYSPTVSAGTQQWNPIIAYVKQLVQQALPDIAFGSLPVSVPADQAPVSAGYASKTDLVPVQSTRLSSFSSYIAFAYFSRIEIDPSVAPSPAPLLSIETPPLTNLTFNFNGGGSQSGQVSVPWKAGPAVGAGPHNYAAKCAVDNFTISCIVVLFP
jgi:hypothetical protein